MNRLNQVERVIDISDPKDFKEVIDEVGKADDYFKDKASKLMTNEKAYFIKCLRIDDECTYRSIASICFEKWNGDWYPSTNQLMGMALCSEASKFFEGCFYESDW